VAGDAIVCMQTFYGGTQAFDVSTGKRLWRANLGGSLQSTPILTDEAVYLATYPGVVYALR
jgi:outer membrane protein assembly factor BamB